MGLPSTEEFIHVIAWFFPSEYNKPFLSKSKLVLIFNDIINNILNQTAVFFLTLGDALRF